MRKRKKNSSQEFNAVLLELAPSYDKNNNSSVFNGENTSDLKNKNNFKHHSKDLNELSKRLQGEINYVRKAGSDFVAMESFTSVTEFEVFIEALLNSCCSMLIEIRTSDDKHISVFYQSVEKFNQELMMVKIGDRHCLFLEPF